MLEFRKVGYAPRRFGPVTFSLAAGEMVLLCGLSGSGKSTLCELVCQRLEPSFGRILLAPGSEVGYIAQDYENQLLGATVSQELELGRRCGKLRGRELCSELSSDFESIWGSLDPHQLSAGQQQALLLESLCLSGAGFFILDESLSWLDRQTLAAVFEQLKRVCRSGGTVLLVSHDLRVLPHVDRVLGLEGGALEADLPREEFKGEHLARFGLWLGSLDSSLEPRSLESIKAQGKSWTCLVGRSGSGKSRFLGSRMGLHPGPKGEDAPDPLGSRALLPQRAESILFRRSVEQELAASLSFGRGEVPEDLDPRGLVPSDWWSRNPRHLSAGQMRYLACLCLVLQMPGTLLLDEPFTGLDARLRGALHSALTRFLSTGRSLMMVTRHPDEVFLYASRTLLIEDGKISRTRPTVGLTAEEITELLGPPFFEDPELSTLISRF